MVAPLSEKSGFYKIPEFDKIRVCEFKKMEVFIKSFAMILRNYRFL